MRLFRLLVKKCFREILRNLKQYISIIFIIAISITLYTGLDSNAIGLSNRVNAVYEKGNIADTWITLNPQFDDYEKMDEDLEAIKNACADESTIETRFYMQSTINSTTLNGLISDSIPKVNAAYDTKRSEYSNNNFFFVDYAFKTKYEKTTGEKLTLNSTLPVSYDTTLICVALKNIVSNEEALKNTCKDLIEENFTNEYLKSAMNTLIEENIGDLQGFLINSIDEFNTNVPTVVLDFTINGFMSHPENIENGEFSKGNYLLSSRLLINSIIKKIGNYLSSDNIIEFLNLLKNDSNEVTDAIIDYLIDYVSDPQFKLAFDAYVKFQISEFEDSINNKTEPDIENFISHLYNQVIVKLNEGADVEAFKNSVQSYFNTKGADNNLIAVLSREFYPSVATIENEKTQAKALTYCLPIIFFVVALLIVLTTISQLVLRERIQIGTLKALGVKKGAILAYYIVEMCLVGLVGVILGFIIGPLLIPNVLNIKYKILYSMPGITYTFPWISASILLVSVLGLIALLTYLLLRKEIGNSASESMRAHTPQIKLARLSKVKLSTSLMIALRNIRVHLLKSIMVLIGVMGCTGLLICGFGIDDVLKVGRDNDLYNFYISDLSASVNLGTAYGKVIEEYETYEFVENVEEYAISTINVTYDNKAINCPLYYFSMNSEFFGFDDELKDGHWNKEGIGLSEAKAEDLGVKVGDEVIITVNGENISYRVETIFYVFATSGIYIYRETIPNLISTPTNVWIDVKDGYDLKESKKFINENSIYTHSCRTVEENLNKIEGYMSSIRTMTNTVKVFAILLAIVVLYNLGVMNFNERIREIATLKVIGFNRISIAKSIIYEMMILVLVGSLLGLTIGMPFEIMVLSTNETAIASWHYYVSGLTYFISIIISLVTSLAVTIGLSSKIKNVSMTESLKSVE